jgi:hypothetical protein
MKSSWNKHIKTELHIMGKKKRRSDYKEPIKCDKCIYSTKNKTTMEKHKLTKHSTKEERKAKFTYYCSYCDYGAFSKDSMKIHEDTEKHKVFMESIKNK